MEKQDKKIICKDCGKEFKVETMVSYDWEKARMNEKQK